MTRRLKTLFLLTLVAPLVIAIAVLVGSTGRFASLASVGTAVLAVILVGPGIALYAAAALSKRAWFERACVVVASCSSALMSILLVAKGGMVLPAVAILESLAAVLALAVANGLRAKARG